MKLVDILARELKEWPEGVECATQDPDKEIRFSPGIRFDFYSTSLADDAGAGFGGGVKVTRAQWQAAVDALKAGEWDGEWKPPVGTVCEVPDGPDYREATIIAYYKDMAVFAFDDEDGHPYVETCLPLECRRIRTAEQIAAEEREAEVDAMLALDTYPNGELAGGLMSRRSFCEALIAAGYRKQVQP